MRYADLTLLCLCLALCASGCKKAETTEPTTQPTTAAQRDSSENQPQTQPAAAENLPEVPKELQEVMQAGSTEILVNREAAALRQEKPTYVEDPKCPIGRLVGVVRFAGQPTRASQAPPVDVEAGPFALKDPATGEVDYYKNAKLRQENYLAADGKGMAAPAHVAIMFRDVKTGTRPPLLPAGFQSIHGGLRSYSGNYADGHIIFARPNVGATFFTWEEYPSDFLLQDPAGKTIFTGRASYKDTGKAKSQIEVGGGKVIWIASEPKPIQSPVLKDLGVYRVEVTRHPWKFGYLVVVDNPFAAAVSASFDFPGVPVGKHRIEVWHPVFKPVQSSYEVEIQPDKTTELAIDFHPPEAASQPEK